ncbi:TM2 domain-containing protein [Ascidiimonas sp. W6]|uniref:TM2 domain-containing protein n=1 Tax=Ascidiimonas meishanensis TaxID=3128903 RepID=UPI0030EC60EA
MENETVQIENQTIQTEQKSDKSFLVMILLCFFLGTLGIHRFYVGKIGTGIFMLITLGGLGVWTFIDLIYIITGSFKDKNGLKIKN